MRKMIVAAAVLALTSAHAAEELKFGDVNYFFKAGQINALANFSSAYQKQKVVSTMEETRGYVFETQLTYGVSDHLNVFLGLDYAYDLQTEIAGNPDIDNDGLSNPSIGASYRLMNQSATSYNVDVGAVANINIQDAKTGTSAPGTSEDGNYAGFKESRSSLEVNGKIGRKWNEANEWQLAAGAQYFKSGESTEMGPSDNDLDEDSSMDLYLRATYQYRPVNEIMFLVSAQATQVGETESENETNVKTTQDSHMDMDFRFTTKYLVTDSTIVKFNYGWSRNADFDTKTGAVSDEVSNRRENFWGLGVDFLF